MWKFQVLTIFVDPVETEAWCGYVERDVRLFCGKMHVCFFVRLVALLGCCWNLLCSQCDVCPVTEDAVSDEAGYCVVFRRGFAWGTLFGTIWTVCWIWYSVDVLLLLF